MVCFKIQIRDVIKNGYIMARLTERVDHPDRKKAIFIFDGCFFKSLFLQNNYVYLGHQNPDIFYGFPNMLKFFCFLLLRAMCSVFTFFSPWMCIKSPHVFPHERVSRLLSYFPKKFIRISTRVYMYFLRAGGKISLACQFSVLTEHLPFPPALHSFSSSSSSSLSST